MLSVPWILNSSPSFCRIANKIKEWKAGLPSLEKSMPAQQFFFLLYAYKQTSTRESCYYFYRVRVIRNKNKKRPNLEKLLTLYSILHYLFNYLQMKKKKTNLFIEKEKLELYRIILVKKGASNIFSQPRHEIFFISFPF